MGSSPDAVRFRACFEQGVTWYSCNYRVCIHSEMCTWHNKNIHDWLQSNSALSLIIFAGMSVSWLAFAESKLKICSLSTCEKEKKEKTLFPVAYFSYFEYAWVIAIFYKGFDNWIVDVIWNMVMKKKVFRIFTVLISLSTVSSSSIKVSFSLDTILSDMNHLMVFQIICNNFSSRLL